MTTEANPQTIDYQSAKLGYHLNADERRKAREGLTKTLKQKAIHEHDFRKARALAFAKYRGKGKGQEEAKILADADAAHLALLRDTSDAEAKGCQARLAELEAERASLRQLADWSREES